MKKSIKTQQIDIQGQTIYADLLASCSKPLFTGKGLSFTQKKVKNKFYWYLNLKLGKTATQKYIGPVDHEETNRLIEREKGFWESAQDKKSYRARLVDMFLSAGGAGLTTNEAKVLSLLERAGVFLAGGILVGTPAFRAIGNNLGVSWETDYRTKDLDLATDHRYSIVLDDKPINIKDLLIDSELGVFEIPALSNKNPSTLFKIQNTEFIIDILVPEIGKPKSLPIFIPHFNTFGSPVRYLDYLFEDIEMSVFPFGAGILVNVPNPARYALHKLVVSQRRRQSDTIKSSKDLSQAKQILFHLLTTRPGSVLVAFDAAKMMGTKFMQQLTTGLKLLPDEVQVLWNEWISE